MKTIYKLFFVSIFFSLVACDSTELDLLEDPDTLTINQIEANKIFSSVQIEFARFFEQASTRGMDVTRMTQMGSSNSYSNAYSPDDFNNIWEKGYADFLADVVTLKLFSTEIVEHPNLFAATEIMEAYVIMTLVDYFGDVPYTEAIQQAENLNPVRDSSASIYAAAKALLNDAKNRMDDEAIGLEGDLFYNNNLSKWEKLANSMLLRIAVNSRGANSNAWSDVNSLISLDNFITNTNDDFHFQWSSSDAPNSDGLDSRHPKFTLGYDGPPSGFQSNFYMWLLHEEKGFDDPRVRYYFYRKTLATPTSTTQVSCVNSDPYAHYDTTMYPFCTAGDGYVGRDHGDNSAILDDSSIRTITGLYPAGGLFDDNSSRPIVNRTLGAAGAGISPIITASGVDFLLAEAYLSLTGNTAMAKTHLTNGVTKSISKVMSIFPNDLVDPDFAPSATDVSDYINFVLNQYDSATSNDAKLNIIMKESYLALFGNGIDSYNNYRRTGMPTNMQPSVSSSPGSFINLFWYPASHVSFNTNADQRPSVAEKVFWAANTSFNLDF